MGLTISIGVLSVLLITSIIINNQIVSKKNQVVQAFGSIDVYLKKRFDLIPNLVELLKKYLAHEKEVLLKTTALRSKIDDTHIPQEKIERSNELTKIMGELNISIENYPNLKADKQFETLQYNLTDIEDQLSAARRAYNAAITSYNNKIQMFPASIIAGIRKDKINTLLEISKTIE